MEVDSSPLVTVLVPCYNHQAFVEKAIRSIIYQTYKNIELIVLDDGSSDNCPQILDEMSRKYGFYYEHQPNMGLIKTLNKGLSLAKGKYICPFASDDIMFLDRIEKQVAVLENRPDAAVCAGNIINIDNNGEILAKQRIRPERELGFDELFWQNIPGPAAPSAMVRRSAIESVGGYDPAVRIEDMYMWLKLANAGHKIIILNDLLAYYRKHDSNTHSNYRMMFDNEMKIIGEYSHHPKYEQVKKRLILSTFVKVANRDKQFAKELCKKLSVRDSPVKILKGLFRMLR
ncbi:glycosyltransferase family 2 protein [Endozoicomonadaceae bacterium StTr2]